MPRNRPLDAVASNLEAHLRDDDEASPHARAAVRLSAGH